MPTSVSIIIPTQDDAARMARLARLMRALTPERQGIEAELVVCDRGSLDATRHLARTLGAHRLVDAEGPLSARLRAGAAAASGTVLVFLDPAMIFPEAGLSAMVQALEADPDAVGGSFRIGFIGDTWTAARLTGFARWQRRHRVYDFKSAVFVRRAIYDQLGGIPALACLGDYAFVRALEARGRTLCLEQPMVGRDIDAYAGRSIPAVAWRWLWRHGLFHLGVAPEVIARIDRPRPRSGQSPR